MRGTGGTASNRTVFISDLHLGSYRARPRSVLSFIERHPSDTLYLVGDVIDLWCFGRKGGWPVEHLGVVRKLLDLARSGTRVVLVPGNHDWGLLQLGGLGLEGIEIQQHALHKAADGRRLLITHGHEQDRFLGSTHAMMRLLFGIGERLAELVSGSRAGQAVLIADAEPSRFERSVAREAARLGFDGVICGHSHVPADKVVEGIRYLNCGDWLRNCTGIVETRTGELRLVQWPMIEAEGSGNELPVADEPALELAR